MNFALPHLVFAVAALTVLPFAVKGESPQIPVPAGALGTAGPRIAAEYPTIAALRAAPVPASAQTVRVSAHSTAGDGGGGVFGYNPASQARSDGGVIVAPAGRKKAGRWLRETNGVVQPEWFGAKGDGITDDRLAIQRALDTAMRQKPSVLSFSPKTYCLTSMATTNAALVGQPAMLAYAAPDSALRSLEIRGNGATLLGNVNDGSNHDRLGAILGLKFNPRILKIENLSFVRAARVIKDLSNSGFQGLWFVSANSGAACGTIEISHCTFTNCHRAWDVGAGSTGSLGLLTIHDTKLLYPYAANTVATFPKSGANHGGAQGELATEWVQNYLIERCFFDGGEDPSKSPNGLRKDGFVLSKAHHMVIRDCTIQNFDVEGVYFDPFPRIDTTVPSFRPPGEGKTVVLPTDFPEKYSQGMALAIGNPSLSGGVYFTVHSVENGEVVLTQNPDSENRWLSVVPYRGEYRPLVVATGRMGDYSFVAENNTFISRTNDAIKEPHGLGNVGIATIDVKSTIRNNTLHGIASAITLKTFFPYENRNAGSVILGNKITLPPIGKVGEGRTGGQLGISLDGPGTKVEIRDNVIDLNTGEGSKGINLHGDSILVAGNTIVSSGNPSTFSKIAYGIIMGSDWKGMFNVRIENNSIEGTSYGVAGGIGRDNGRTIKVQGLKTKHVLHPVQHAEWLEP